MRHGATTGDVLIFLGTLSIAAALLYPAWSVRGFRATVEAAIADVDAVAAAARSVRQSEDRWPAAAAPGEAPADLAQLGGADGPFSREAYTIGWTSWEVVDSMRAAPPAAPPSPDDPPPDSVGPRLRPVVRTVGAVAVYSDEETLLAELEGYYAEQTSFVLDTMWLLILPERARAPAPGR
jgi:hypothetical protein